MLGSDSTSRAFRSMSSNSQLIETSPTRVDRSFEKEMQNQFENADTIPSSAEEFLNQITCSVNTEDIYSIQRVFYLQEGTHTANDYVCLILKVQVSEMIAFYGGQYLFQLWKNKERLFQFVHSSPVMNNYYCSNTELCYMTESSDDSQSFIYLIKPYKQQFHRILCPFSSSKEVKLFVNNEILVMAQKRTIKAVMLKDLINCDKTSYYYEETLSNFSINSTNQNKEVIPLLKESLQAKLESFKSTSSSVFGLAEQMRKKPSTITMHQDQILLDFNILGIDFDICEDQASQVGLVAAGQSELVYFLINYKNSNTIRLERIENGKYGWKDVKSRCFWDDRYTNLIMRRLSPQQKLFAFQSEKGFVDFYINMKDMIASTRVYANYAGRKNAEQAAVSVTSSLNLENFSLLREIQVGTEAIYGTLVNGESFSHQISGHLQRLDLTNSDAQKSIPVGILNEKFIKRHISIFQDLSLLNDTAVFTHGQLISVFEFSRKTWSHHSQSGVAISHNGQAKLEKHFNLSYFGYSQLELLYAKIVTTNSDSVCEIICEDRQGQLRKFCYFPKGKKKITDTIQVQPMLIEQKVQSTLAFDYPVQTLCVQGSSESYRENGETDIAVFIKIQKAAVKSQRVVNIKEAKTEGQDSDIFMLNKDCQLIQLMSNIKQSFHLLKVLNAPTDILYLFDRQSMCIDLYDLTHVTAVIDQRMLESRLVTRLTDILNLDPLSQLFKDGDYLYYLHRGQLIQVDIYENKQTTINLGCQISEVLAIQGNSVYFKTESLNVHFVDLDWLKTGRNDVSNLLTMQPIFRVQSVIFTRFEYDLIGNKIATWVDPYVLKVFPPLNFNFLDCVGSFGIEQRAIAWNVDSGDPNQYNQTVSALDPVRDEIITWSLGNGKITDIQSLGSNIYQGFKRHGEWNNCTLIYKIIPQLARDNSQKAIWRKVTVSNIRLVTVHKEFEHQFVRGRKVFVSSSNDLLIEFWDGQLAIYSIANGKTNRIIEEKNNFFQVNSPAYFSPDFRTYLAFEDTYSLNTNKLIVWQIKGSEKPETNNLLQTPNIDQVVRIHERKPVVTLLSSNIISYLDKDNLWVRCPLDKTAQQQSGQTQESYLTKEQVKHYLLLHILNKNSTRISRLPFTQVLSIMVDQYKLRQKGQFDTSEVNLRLFANNSLRLVSSFSFYHWRVIELIENNLISIKEINREILKELVNIILPDGEGVLHKLLRKNVDQFEELISVLGTQIKINLLPNLKGQTPLHLCVQRSYSRAADLILSTVAKYPLDDHSSFISDILKDLLVLCPVSLARYFESRVIKPDWGINQTQGQLKKTDQQCAFGVSSLPMKVTDEKTLSKSLFVLDKQDKDQSSEDEQPQNFQYDKEQRIKVIGAELQIQTTQQMNMPMTYEILDFPGVHTFGTRLNREFLQTLAEQQDVESVFQTKFVRALLEYQLPQVKRVIFWKLLLPYLFYLFLFNFYAIWIFEQQKNGLPNSVTQNTMYYSSQGILLCFTMYFLWSEIRRFGGTQSMGQFFSNAWNIIDIVPLILVTTSILITLIPQTQSLIWQRYLNSVSSFFMWIKCYFFFRIYRDFSQMIKILTSVFRDMATYLALLFIAIVSFAGTFYVLSNNQPTGEQYLLNYPEALMMMWDWALGNQDSGVFGSQGYLLQYFFYILVCVGLIVLMLNLLIAIIGASNARVKSMADISMYTEFADIIADNLFLINQRQTPSDSQDFLVVTQHENLTLQSTEETSVEDQIRNLSQQVSQQSEELLALILLSGQTINSQDQRSIEQLEESLAQVSTQVSQISKKLN